MVANGGPGARGAGQQAGQAGAAERVGDPGAHPEEPRGVHEPEHPPRAGGPAQALVGRLPPPSPESGASVYGKAPKLKGWSAGLVPSDFSPMAIRGGVVGEIRKPLPLPREGPRGILVANVGPPGVQFFGGVLDLFAKVGPQLVNI